jgi:hypothetical protein
MVMLYKYHRRTIYAFLVIMLLFAVIFVAALFNLRNNKAMFNLGIPYDVEDIMVMVVSFLAIIQVFVMLVRIEHHKELRQRVTA